MIGKRLGNYEVLGHLGAGGMGEVYRARDTTLGRDVAIKTLPESQPNHQNIFRMPSTGGPAEAVTWFPSSGLFLEEPALSPDGRALLYCRSNGGSSLWVLTLDRATD